MLFCDKLTKSLIELAHINFGLFPALHLNAISILCSQTLIGCRWQAVARVLSHNQTAVSQSGIVGLSLNVYR